MTLKRTDLESLAKLYAVSERQLVAPIGDAEMVQRLDRLQQAAAGLDDQTFEDLMTMIDYFLRAQTAGDCAVISNPAGKLGGRDQKQAGSRAHGKTTKEH